MFHFSMYVYFKRKKTKVFISCLLNDLKNSYKATYTSILQPTCALLFGLTFLWNSIHLLEGKKGELIVLDKNMGSLKLIDFMTP